MPLRCAGLGLILRLLAFGVTCTRLDASSVHVDQELSNIMNELWRLDANRLRPGTDYNITLQGKAGYVAQGTNTARDYASAPLFSYVDENKLKSIKTYSKFLDLLDNYEKSTGVTESVTAEELAENYRFLDAILQTEVMKRAHKYLVSKGKSSTDLRLFKNQLYGIWFRLYHRDRSAGEDSCGFEHVFVGETKFGREVMGFHNWVQFYLEEKNKHLDYKGYKAVHREVPQDNDHVLNVQFSWNGLVKPVGSTFVGVSPEFEVALFTIVFLKSTERVTHTVVNVDKYQLEVVVYRHGRSIGTSYPKLLSSNNKQP